MNTAISLKDVNFSYDAESVVLQDVNFAVYQGEFVGIIGPNGGGKTTLLKLIMGLLKPLSGEIAVFNKSPELFRKAIGYVPQFTAFNRNFPMLVKNMVLMGRLGSTRRFGNYTTEDKNIVYTVLKKMEIENLQSRAIGSLSGGQLQRVMIARALASNPKLLLLDEPTTNIDIHAGKNLFDLLKTINHEVTILVVSHDIGFISRYIKRVACINKRVFCHQTSSLTSEIIQDIYDIPVRVIQHEHSNFEDKKE